MRRLLLAAAFLALPTAAMAGDYAAAPATPAKARLIVRDLAWQCGPAGCVARGDGPRAAVVCQSLARKAGALTRFSVDGRAFDAAELAACNAFAR